MKILLILANERKRKNFTRFIYPPLELQQLASLTPLEHAVALVDERFKTIRLDKNYDYDLIGISCTTLNAFRAYELADEFRRRGKTVVLGGWHPSALPEEAKQHADAVVIGEAEDTWPMLLRDFEQDRLKPFYYQDKSVDPDDIPSAIHHTSTGIYLFDVIQSSRGCPYGCEFCSISNMKFSKKFRTRSIENVLEEIKSIKRKNIVFNDPSLTINQNYTKSLFRTLRDLNKKFFCNGNINILGKDDELLRLASEAGCIGWFVGLESISQKSIDAICKKPNKVREYRKSIKKIREYNMAVNGSFIFGFDTDKSDIFEKTASAINDLDLDVAICDILTPYPGTPLYDRFEKEGRILTKDWSKYDTLHVVFKPKNMSEEELLQGTLDTLSEIYSIPNTIKRTIRSMELGYPFLTTAIQNLPILTTGIIK